jgi:hypothetical protein
VIIIVLLIISYVYFNRQQRREQLILNQEDGVLSTVKDEGYTIVQTASFNGSLGQLTSQNAIVIWGEIPYDYPYWGITGYAMDRQIGDSVSQGCTKHFVPNDSIAAIMTSNSLMFEQVKRRLLDEWTSTRKLNIMPIYVSLDAHPGVHTLTLRIDRHTPQDPTPPFQCRLYTSPNIAERPAPIVQLKRRDLVPKESDTVSESVWNSSAARTVQDRGYTILREVEVRHHDGPTTNGAEYTNRDITQLMSDDIRLTAGESIAVVAANHVASHRGTCSSVLFMSNGSIYSRHMTGSSSNYDRNTGTTIRAVLIINTPGDVNDEMSIRVVDPRNVVQVVERIYTEPSSGIGPGVESILPMKVYIVQQPV